MKKLTCILKLKTMMNSKCFRSKTVTNSDVISRGWVNSKLLPKCNNVWKYSISYFWTRRSISSDIFENYQITLDSIFILSNNYFFNQISIIFVIFPLSIYYIFLISIYYIPVKWICSSSEYQDKSPFPFKMTKLLYWDSDILMY